MEENKEKNKNTADSLLSVVVISALLIVIGVIFLMYPELSITTLVYLAAVLLWIYGLIRIAIYWSRKEYLNIKNYDFSFGVCSVTIGVILFVNAAMIGEKGIVFLGFCILSLSIIILQYALQIRIMNGLLFPFVLLIAVFEYIVAMIAILGLENFFDNHKTVFYVCMILCGILSFVSMGLTAFRSHNLKKEEQQKKESAFDADAAFLPDVEEENIGIETDADITYDSQNSQNNENI